MTTKVEYVVTCAKNGEHDMTYEFHSEEIARHTGEVVAKRGYGDVVLVQCIHHTSHTVVETLAEYRDGKLVKRPLREMPFLRGHFENWRHNSKLPLPDLRYLAEWLRQNADMLEHLQDRQRDVSEELLAIHESVTRWHAAKLMRGVI